MVKGHDAGARQAVHFYKDLYRFELTNGCLLGITIDSASANVLMTWELQSNLEASGIQWPALRYRIPCMAHIIQLALGALRCTFGVKDHTKSWEANKHD